MTWDVTYDGVLMGTVEGASFPSACRAADAKFGRDYQTRTIAARITKKRRRR